MAIDVRADARAILASHYPNGEADLNPARLRMARIPDGAVLIDNPVSKAPGFTMGNVHVMAGVPVVFQTMVASLMATISGGTPLMSESVRIQRGEGDIAEALGRIADACPQVSIGSYPTQRNGRFEVNVVLRSTDRAALDAAANDVRALV